MITKKSKCLIFYYFLNIVNLLRYYIFMATVSITRTVLINKNIETVFSHLVDWQNQSEWMVGTSVEPYTGNGRHLGDQIKAITKIGPIRILDTMAITDWSPPHRCSVVHTGKVIKGTGTFLVRYISKDKSSFIWSEYTELPLGIVGLIGWYLAKPIIVIFLIISLNKLKKWIEHSR